MSASAGVKTLGREYENKKRSIHVHNPKSKLDIKLEIAPGRFNTDVKKVHSTSIKLPKRT